MKISGLETELEDAKRENLNLNSELKKISELKASNELQESYQINEKNLIECRKELDLWKNR